MEEKQPKYAALFDRPLGVDEYPTGAKRFSRVPARVIVGTVAGICKVLYRYRVDKRENLYPLIDQGGVVVISNHTSYLDVVFMYLGIRPRYWPRFIARDTLFEKNALLAWIFAHIGAFPIKRDTADRTAVKRAARMLKAGEVVGIMPEGTRRGKGNVESHVHGGAALIARMGKAPILPMAVHNVDKVKRKGERLRFPKITVEFGDPILLEDFDFLPKDDRLDGCVWYALRECFAMFQGVAAEEVDMVALFPDDKDFTGVFAAHPVPHHMTPELVEARRAEQAAKRAAEEAALVGGLAGEIQADEAPMRQSGESGNAGGQGPSGNAKAGAAGGRPSGKSADEPMQGPSGKARD